MSQIIWLARHGNRLDFVHPEWFNTACRRYDPPLSDNGFIQARQLAQRLQAEKIEYIFASPFLRTIQTAHLIAEQIHLPIKLEAGLGEWHNPDWMSEKPEIHLPDELEQLYPLIDWSYRSQILPDYPESLVKVKQRTQLAINKILQKFRGNMLIVGHAISVTGIAQALIGDGNQINTSLCSLTQIIQQDHQWLLALNGDTSHLSS